MKRTQTLIVGGGPAGIAVAAALKRRGTTALVLEKGDSVAPAWARHYDRLRLHTNKGASSLPGRPMPASYPRYPTRDQVFDYLNGYAAAEQIDVRLGEEVSSCRAHEAGWEVETIEGERFEAENLVIATGLSHIPSIPEYPGLDGFEGEVLHSAEYRNGVPHQGKSVLVVGFGNSAGEIAVDLCDHGADTHISVRNPSVVVPRDFLGIPILTLSRWLSFLPPRISDKLSRPLLMMLVGDISRYGIPAADIGPLEQIATEGKVPLLDVGTMARLKDGSITAHPGIREFTASGVVFDDGIGQDFDVVVLGTGYRAGADLLLDDTDGLIDSEGMPLVSGGPTARPGLYFCGFHEPATGRLREIGIEAERIGDLVAEVSRVPAQAD